MKRVSKWMLFALMAFVMMALSVTDISHAQSNKGKAVEKINKDVATPSVSEAPAADVSEDLTAATPSEAEASAEAAQPTFSVDSNTITITIPKTIKTGSPAEAYPGINIIVSALLTLLMGFFAKKWTWLDAYFSTTQRKVGAVGLISSLIVCFIFGFSPDALTILWQSILGVFTMMGTYGFIQEKNKPVPS